MQFYIQIITSSHAMSMASKLSMVGNHAVTMVGNLIRCQQHHDVIYAVLKLAEPVLVNGLLLQFMPLCWIFRQYFG